MNIEEKKKLLMLSGVSANLKGYHFILKALEILDKQGFMNMESIYKNILKEMPNITRNSIERSIRYTFEKMYKENDFIKNNYLKKPSPTNFLYDIYYNADNLTRILDKKKKENKNE